MHSMTASLSFVGVFKKTTARRFTASVSFVGSFGKRMAKVFTGSISFIGNLIGQSLSYIYVPIAIIINTFSSNKDLQDSNTNSTMTTGDDIRDLNGVTGQSDVATGSSSGILSSDSTERTLE
jgi:hypothetical protein